MDWTDYFFKDTLYQDEYAYTQGVLKNKLGVKDEKTLEIIEARYIKPQLKDFISFSFNTEGLKAVHHHLFQGLYDWAGEFRQVNMEI